MSIKYIQQETGLYLSINHSLLESMKQLTLQHFPNEFGGVLVGNYALNGTQVNVIDFICPQQYQQSPTYFKRETTFINEKLEDIYLTTKGNIFYIGEWHSHPNIIAAHSHHDYMSMCQLLPTETKIENPLLLIIGGRKTNLNIQFYLLVKKKLLPYVTTKN